MTEHEYNRQNKKKLQFKKEYWLYYVAIGILGTIVVLSAYATVKFTLLSA